MKMLAFVPAYVYSSVFQSLGIRKKGFELPKVIGEYKLAAQLSKKNYPFQVGLYENGKEQIIAKIWTGSKNSIHYSSLLHETSVLKILSRATSKKVKNKVSFPRHIKTLVRRNRLILLCTYQKGVKVSSLPLSMQLESYRRSRAFLKEVTNALTYEEMQKIGVRGFRFYILSAPLITSLAMLRRPLMTPSLVLSLLRFYSGALQLKRQALVLVHGDLHADNIIQNGNKISIIDCEQMRISYKELEDVTTLASTRNHKGFENVLWTNADQMKEKRRARFSSLMIHANTFNLIGNMKKKNVTKYKKMLHKKI